MVVRIPTGIAPGRYRIRFIADPRNTTREYSERNNAALCDCTVVAG
jgi:hypothetical protein